jgi:hypothetical protein
VVLPAGYTGNAKVGDIAVLMDFQKLSFSIGIIGDVGPNANDYNEVSLSMAWDLGYSREEANGRRGPNGNFGLLYIPGTKSIARSVSSVAGLVALFRKTGNWLTNYS